MRGAKKEKKTWPKSQSHKHTLSSANHKVNAHSESLISPSPPSPPDPPISPSRPRIPTPTPLARRSRDAAHPLYENHYPNIDSVPWANSAQVTSSAANLTVGGSLRLDTLLSSRFGFCLLLIPLSSSSCISLLSYFPKIRWFKLWILCHLEVGKTVIILKYAPVDFRGSVSHGSSHIFQWRDGL